MTLEARREYLEAIRLRYKNNTRGQRTRILDEFCEVCSYYRKRAIRILGRKDTDSRAAKPGP